MFSAHAKLLIISIGILLNWNHGTKTNRNQNLSENEFEFKFTNLHFTPQTQIHYNFGIELVFLILLFAAPDPPSNLSVSVRGGKTALISWSPPSTGNFTSFKLRVIIKMYKNKLFIRKVCVITMCNNPTPTRRYWAYQIHWPQIVQYQSRKVNFSIRYVIWYLEPVIKCKPILYLIIVNRLHIQAEILQQVSPMSHLYNF